MKSQLSNTLTFSLFPIEVISCQAKNHYITISCKNIHFNVSLISTSPTVDIVIVSVSTADQTSSAVARNENCQNTVTLRLPSIYLFVNFNLYLNPN